MPRKTYVLLTASVLLVLVVTPLLSSAWAQSNDFIEYFSQSGHGVRDPFLKFFRETGGVNQHGYPITDAFVDERTNLLVQYFQRSRMEWHPGNPEPFRVQLGLLGEEMGRREPPIPVSKIPSPSDPTCRYFKETQHSVCWNFLTYWQDHGGMNMYGPPISEYTIEGDLIVQDFQRGRMEWRPEKPEGERIQLANIGFEYYHWAGLDPARLPGRPLSAYYKPLLLHASASLVDSTLSSGNMQTGYVQISDQLGRPIEGAAVSLIVEYPDFQRTYDLPPTNGAGVSTISFTVEPARGGSLVWMRYVIAYEGLVANTRTNFMIWYY